MKILYLDPNAQYLNPTAALLPVLMLSVHSGTRFFGPGYSSREELAQGVRRWVDANGPFDIVMLGPLIPFLSKDDADQAQGAAFVSRYAIHAGYDEADLRRYFRDVLAAIAELPIPLKVVAGVALDTYAATQAHVDRVLESGVVLLTPNHQFVKRMADWPTDVLQRENHLQRKKRRLSDAWFEFLSAYPDRVLTGFHYLGEHEFCLTALEARRWDVVVPGVEYALRRDAVASLRSSGLRVAPKKYFHAYRVANRLGLPVYRQYVTSRLYNLLFQQSLFTSRIAYTAPSAPGNLIRKFLEIPAAGAVLACVPPNGFEALGFENGRHYVQADPADLPRTVVALSRDPGLQRIADAGRELVLTRHSMRARAGQIAQCLDALRAGTYRGSSWRNGEFVLTTRPAQVASTHA